MPQEIFISHSTKDKLIADAVCSHLESVRIRCWIAPRDITPGTNYGDAIIKAIRSCKILVVILTQNANISTHVTKEVERAVSNGLMIIPFRVEDVTPSGAMEYFLSSEHWLDAMTPPLENHIQRLVSIVNSVLGSAQETTQKFSNEKIIHIKEVPPDQWTSTTSLFSKIKSIFQDK